MSSNLFDDGCKMTIIIILKKPLKIFRYIVIHFQNVSLLQHIILLLNYQPIMQRTFISLNLEIIILLADIDF